MALGHVRTTRAEADAIIDAILAVQPTEMVTLIRNGVQVGTEEQPTRAPVIRRTAGGEFWLPAERRFAALGGMSDGTTVIPQARDAVDVTLDTSDPIVRERAALAGGR